MDIFSELYRTKVLVVIAGINSNTEWKLPGTRKKIREILESTSLKNTQIFELKTKQDYENLKRIIVELGNEFLQLTSVNEGNIEVLIDHVFPVKGIGTVILGIVKQGEVQSGQMLEITGYESAVKKVIIRSIQKHDRNFKVAYEGDRVGLALKGNISPRDISRDNIIVTPGIFKQEKEIEVILDYLLIEEEIFNQVKIKNELIAKLKENTVLRYLEGVLIDNKIKNYIILINSKFDKDIKLKPFLEAY